MSFIFDLFTQANPDGNLGSELQGLVESIPHTPSRITQLGLFRAEFLNGTGIDFDVSQMTLELIDPVARGATSTFVDADPSNLVHFNTYTFKRSARVTEVEIRDIRRMGTAQFESAKNAFKRKLRKPLLEVRTGREWQQLGAIRGLIVNTAGTVTTNIFTKLGQTAPAAMYFDLTATHADGAFNAFCSRVADRVADELAGSTGYTGIHCFVTSEDMIRIGNLPEVRETFRYQQGQSFLQAGKGYGTTFVYGGITFEVYRGTVGAVDFLAETQAVAFPLGADNFLAAYAPSTKIVDPTSGAELEGGVLGQVEFAFPFIDPRGEYEEIEIQSHPLFLNLRPRSTVEIRWTEAP